MKRKSDYPLLKGFLSEPFNYKGGCRISVWCPHCNAFHLHGWNLKNNPKIATHRVAHCHTRHDHFKDGYLIKPFTKKEIKEYLEPFVKLMLTKKP